MFRQLYSELDARFAIGFNVLKCIIIESIISSKNFVCPDTSVLIAILVFKIILVMILVLKICFSYDSYSSSQYNFNSSSRDNFSSRKCIILEFNI